MTDATFFDHVGGHPTFEKLTRAFYRGIARDPELRPMYPDEDLEPARVRLQMFLEQFWGGPTTYSDTRGHPRLRLRHQPFPITPAARERWLVHMTAAVAELKLSDLHASEMLDYFDRAAHAMTNHTGD